jgi:hypothetical protein
VGKRTSIENAHVLTGATNRAADEGRWARAKKGENGRCQREIVMNK